MSRRIATAIVIAALAVIPTGCWRPNVVIAAPDGSPRNVVLVHVEFDANVSQQMRDVTWARLADVAQIRGYYFTSDPASDKLNIHGDFPTNDVYPCTFQNVWVSCTPAMSYVDHATIGDDTWRADVYIRPQSSPTDLMWAIDTATSY